MDKTDNNVVFYGPLPVSKPCPVLKPNDRIQLQPTVHPVAITPYISMEGEEAEGQPLAEEKVEEVSRKGEKRVSARVSGVFMLLITVLSIIFFAFSMVEKYPIGAIEQYASMNYFYQMFQVMFETKQFAQFDLVFVPYLVAIAFVAIIVNLVLSIIAVATGRRRGYSLFAFIAFITLIVAAFYQMKFFSQIKDLKYLLLYDYGWPCLMLIIVGGANLVAAFVCSVICPKHKIVETVEF